MDQVESEDFFAVCVEKKRNKSYTPGAKPWQKKSQLFVSAWGNQAETKSLGLFLFFLAENKMGDFEAPSCKEGFFFLLELKQTNQPMSSRVFLPVALAS